MAENVIDASRDFQLIWLQLLNQSLLQIIELHPHFHFYVYTTKLFFYYFLIQIKILNFLLIRNICPNLFFIAHR